MHRESHHDRPFGKMALQIRLKGRTRDAATVAAQSIGPLAASTNCFTQRRSSEGYADLPCLAAGLFAVVSFACF
jgi:hypothetical protein